MRGEREGGEQSPRGRMGSKGDGSGKEEEEREERGRQRKGGGRRVAVRELPPELQQLELGLIGRRRGLLIVGSVALPYEPSCPSAGRRSNVVISIDI